MIKRVDFEKPHQMNRIRLVQDKVELGKNILSSLDLNHKHLGILFHPFPLFDSNFKMHYLKCNRGIFFDEKSEF